jgi:uncharacterized protein YndB with AHSA1/START domain
MYAFDTSVEIAAPPERVWRALCDPAEVVRWDTGVAGAIDAPADYPQPGQHVRWRYTNGPFRLLHDRPKEVVANEKLRSLLAVGPLRFDETYTLEARDGGTLLTAAMLVWVPVPLLGVVVERAYAGAATKATVSASLRGIKRWCEAGG